MTSNSERDPVISVSKALEALEYALIHTHAIGRHYSRKDANRLQRALDLLKEANSHDYPR